MTEDVDAHGNVNYMRAIPLDEPGAAIKWRLGVADMLAMLMNLPGTFSHLCSNTAFNVLSSGTNVCTSGLSRRIPSL
jgi:hypothetical protein